MEVNLILALFSIRSKHQGRAEFLKQVLTISDYIPSTSGESYNQNLWTTGKNLSFYRAVVA